MISDIEYCCPSAITDCISDHPTIGATLLFPRLQRQVSLCLFHCLVCILYDRRRIRESDIYLLSTPRIVYKALTLHRSR